MALFEDRLFRFRVAAEPDPKVWRFKSHMLFRRDEFDPKWTFLRATGDGRSAPEAGVPGDTGATEGASRPTSRSIGFGVIVSDLARRILGGSLQASGIDYPIDIA